VITKIDDPINAAPRNILRDGEKRGQVPVHISEDCYAAHRFRNLCTRLHCAFHRREKVHRVIICVRFLPSGKHGVAES